MIPTKKEKSFVLRRVLFVFIFSLLASFFSSVNAQVVDQTPPAKRKFKYSGKVEESYDSTKNLTTVFFNLLSIKALEDPEGTNDIPYSFERLDFSNYFAYKGKNLTTPKEVGIGFLAQTETPQKYLDYDLTFTADGQLLSVGKMNYKDLGTVSTPRLKYYKLKLETALSYNQFLILANAKKVKVRIGTVKFNFEKEHLEAIRDLASRTVL
jgi:hypothetical protein